MARAIESIQAQTYPNWELIISEDASTDNTVQVIERYLDDQRIKLFRQPKNIGYLENKNHAFTLAEGQLITQLDADDTSHPERLERQVNVFLNFPEIQICGTNYQQIDLNDNSLGAKDYDEDFLIQDIMEEYPFWFPGLMFRKSVVEEFGLFSDYFAGIYGDDNYWTIRVNREYPIYFVNEVLYNYRVNPNSITNVLDNPRKMIVNEILGKLISQQKVQKTDWLEQGFETNMRAYEAELLSNKSLMAEKYRIWAARAIDKSDLAQAKVLLKKSIEYQGFNRDTYKTMAYYWRRKILK